MFKFRATLLAFAATAALTLPAVGSGQQNLTTARHHTMGWSFVPAIREGQVIGFLAFQSEEAPILGNMQVIWFQRETSNWSSWAWEENDLGTAVIGVRAITGNLNLFGLDADLCAAANAAPGDVVAPKLVIEGMYADDILFEAVQQSPDPAAAIEALADFGWPVGKRLSSMLAEADKFCEGVLVTPMNGLMDSFVQKTELAVTGSTSMVDPCEAIWPCTCTETIVTTPSGAGAWILQETTPTYMGWRCKWYRPVVQNISSSGQTAIFCIDCTSTNVLHTAQHCVTETVTPDDCDDPSAQPPG